MEIDLETALHSPRDIGFDFETEGLNWFKNDKPLSLGLWTNGVSGYIDLRKYSKEILHSFFIDFFKMHRVILQNAKFDFHYLAMYYLSLDEIENICFSDIMLIGQIIDENKAHSLDFTTESLLGSDYLINKRKVSDYVKVNKIKYWQQIPFEMLALRGEEDAKNTYLIYNILRPQLKELEVYDLEKKLLFVLLRMEHNGVFIDKDYLYKLNSYIEKLMAKIHSKFPENLDLNSHDQVGKYLYQDLGIIPKVFTLKKKVPKTDKITLAEIDHPIAKEITDYRSLQHTKSTYVDGFLNLLDHNNYLHCNFRQMGARTGRMSCVDPNLQQLPKRGREGKWIKTAFIGDVTAFDYHQMEAVLYAFMNNDDNMIKAIKEGKDLYKHLAETLYFKNDISKNEREISKTLFLGRIYGMGDVKFRKKSQGLNPQSSRKFFDKLTIMQNKVKKDIENNGYIETILHRKRHLSIKEAYKGLNAEIQGTAADIIKMAMVKLPKHIQNKMGIQIHDELFFRNLEEKEKKIIKDIMCDFPPFLLSVEYGSGKNWWQAFCDKERILF